MCYSLFHGSNKIVCCIVNRAQWTMNTNFIAKICCAFMNGGKSLWIILWRYFDYIPFFFSSLFRRMQRTHDFSDSDSIIKKKYQKFKVGQNEMKNESIEILTLIISSWWLICCGVVGLLSSLLLSLMFSHNKFKLVFFIFRLNCFLCCFVITLKRSFTPIISMFSKTIF